MVAEACELLCVSQLSNPELGNWKVDVWVELLYGVKLEAVLLSVICPFAAPTVKSSSAKINVNFFISFIIRLFG